MSKLEVDKIDPQSGTDLELGSSGDTITIPAGVTFDSSAATNTLPSTVVTTTGTQTLTNKSIAATQLTGTITPSDSTVSLAKLTATGTKDATTFLRGDNTFAEAGGGKVLQVVSAVIDATFANNSASFIEVTSHNLSITPSATSSKILVFMNFNTRSSGTVEQFYTIYRGTTNVGSTNGLGATHDDNGNSDTEVQFALQVLDSPNTTSSVNYHLRSKSNGSATARVNNKGSDSVITLMEIGA